MSRRWRRLSRATNLAVCVPTRLCSLQGPGTAAPSLVPDLHELQRAPRPAAIVWTICGKQRSFDAHGEVCSRADD